MGERKRFAQEDNEMPFVHPGIFWLAAAAAGVPIVIHLLNRRRFRVRKWAAMEFLLESIRRNRRRLRMEELILLAIRCLVIALLGMAIGRFTGCRSAGMLVGDSAATVFVLDDSVSMGQKVGDSTLFARAIEDIKQQIKQLPASAQVAVVRTTSPSSDAMLLKLSFVKDIDVDAFAARLGELRCDDRASQWKAALECSRNALGETDLHKRIVVLSDFRSVDFAEEDGKSFSRLSSTLQEGGVEMILCDYGQSARDNLTVQSLEMLDRIGLAGQPVRFAVTVRNDGQEDRHDIRLGLSSCVIEQDKQVEAKLAPLLIRQLPASQETRLEFSVVPPSAGPMVVKVQLPPDELKGDNSAAFSLVVRKAVRVLLVDGTFHLEDRLDRESYRLALALDPRQDASSGNEVTVTSVDNLEQYDLGDYDVVMLLDVPQLPGQITTEGQTEYPLVTALEQYVFDGGGLAMFTGPNTNLGFYNNRMYAEGFGLCPLKLKVTKGDDTRRESYVRLDPTTMERHPVVSILQAGNGELAGMIRFHAFTVADPLSAAAASKRFKAPRILARFGDSDASPAIVSREFGQGQVLLFLSTASVRWNDWADDIPSGLYVSAMQDMVNWLTRKEDVSRTAFVGVPIVSQVQRALRDAEFVLHSPDEMAGAKTLAAAIRSGTSVVESPVTGDAGIYELHAKKHGNPPVVELFARNVNPKEGRLHPAGREELKAFWKGKPRYVRMDMSQTRTQAESTEALENASSRNWVWVLAAVVGLLAMETILGLRFGHHPPREMDKKQK